MSSAERAYSPDSAHAEDNAFIRRWFMDEQEIGNTYDMTCKWEPLRNQILLQWARLTTRDVDGVGPNRGRLAQLIHRRYGINPLMIENYLRNFERILPLG